MDLHMDRHPTGAVHTKTLFIDVDLWQENKVSWRGASASRLTLFLTGIGADLPTLLKILVVSPLQPIILSMQHLMTSHELYSAFEHGVLYKLPDSHNDIPTQTDQANSSSLLQSINSNHSQNLHHESYLLCHCYRRCISHCLRSPYQTSSALLDPRQLQLCRFTSRTGR